MNLSGNSRSELRLGYLIEVVACFALGSLTLSAFLKSDEGMPVSTVMIDRHPVFRTTSSIFRLIESSRCFGAGFALACGVGLAVETSRRRGPAPWGIGRLAIAILPIVMGLTMLMDQIQLNFAQLRFGPSPYKNYRIVYTNAWVRGYFVEWLPLFLASLWVVLRYAYRPIPGPADPREWVGRSMVVVLIVACVAQRVFQGW